jgi:sugar porter (SP) family MFS transporter
MADVHSYMGLRGPALASVIGTVAGLAFFLFGYDQGDLAGILTMPSFRRQFPQTDTIGRPDDYNVANLQGLTVGIWNLGCFFSAILTIVIGDRLGRRKTMLMGLTFLAIGEIIQATSFSWSQFLVGRAIAGWGNGFNTATVPAWQAELTKAHRRGTLLMVTAGTFIAAGLAFSYWMDFAFAYLEPSSAAWRVPIAIQLIFLLVAALLLLLMPESPRWLILTGREDEALRVLSALNDLPKDSHDVRQEFLQIKDAVIEMSKGSFGSAFSMGDYRHVHRTCLAVVLQIFQQMTGINLVTQFLALMFIQLYGYSGWVSRLIAACVGTEFLMASFIPVIGIDRFWGRRSLMMFGASGMCISMTILTAMLWLNNTAGKIVSTVFIFLYCTFFAIGWQGMAWLYQVEIVPLRIRGPANAMSTAANWLVNYAVVQIAPVAFHNIGYRTYIIFAVFNFFIVPVVYFLYPETGFRSLEEVDVIFYNASQQPNPWLNVRKIAANEPLWYNKGNDSDGEAFNYEETEWHKKHLRFSDEVKTSEGETTTLRNDDSVPGSDQGKKVSDGSASDDEMITNYPTYPAPGAQLDASGPWPNAGPFNPADVAPSPHVPRLSASRDGRGAGIGY